MSASPPQQGIRQERSPASPAMYFRGSCSFSEPPLYGSHNNISGSLQSVLFVYVHQGTRLKTNVFYFSSPQGNRDACLSRGVVARCHSKTKHWRWPRHRNKNFRKSKNYEFIQSGHVKSGGCVSGCSDCDDVHWNRDRSVQWSHTSIVPSRKESFHIEVLFTCRLRPTDSS